MGTIAKPDVSGKSLVTIVFTFIYDHQRVLKNIAPFLILLVAERFLFVTIRFLIAIDWSVFSLFGSCWHRIIKYTNLKWSLNIIELTIVD